MNTKISLIRVVSVAKRQTFIWSPRIGLINFWQTITFVLHLLENRTNTDPSLRLLLKQNVTPEAQNAHAPGRPETQPVCFAIF